MRLSGLAILLSLLLVPAARAQDSAAIAVPPAPPIMATPTSIPTQPEPATPEPAAPQLAAPQLEAPQPAAPQPAAPPGLVVTPVPPLNADSGTLGPAASAAPPAPPASSWLPGAMVKLGVLDKIDGTVSAVTIATGATATIGDLQIAVQSCVTRPPDEIPDAAVFLTAQNPQVPSAPPIYRGWMVRSVPGATVVGDASETFRIIGCS